MKETENIKKPLVEDKKKSMHLYAEARKKNQKSACMLLKVDIDSSAIAQNWHRNERQHSGSKARQLDASYFKLPDLAFLLNN